MRTLVVTNDFPPRPGGIQSFVYGMVSRLPSPVVYTSRWHGWERFDASLPFPVVREATSVLLPVPAVVRRARQVARAEGCESVWFGAAAPLGLMAGALRRGGVARLVATTHGHEASWAVLPGPRALLRRIAGQVDVTTYLGEFTRSRLAPALGPFADRLRRLAPGVDTSVFAPGPGEAMRERHRLGTDPVVVCVSRLMPRKGQDMLLRALPSVRARVPGTRLLLVGGGPSRARLQRLAASLRVSEAVVFTGSVPAADLPAYYRAGDVFAMPCRTRLAGIDVEGLGIVYLEASACGLPVVAGTSGGAPETVLDGETGYVVEPRSPAAVADRLVALLADRALCRRLGEAGHDWVRREWRVERFAADLRRMLTPAGETPTG